MKTIFTLAGLLFLSTLVKAQAVLNEIYAYPSVGNHEFFELYNTSTSQIPVSVDGYTLISYFDDGKKKGFYILDLPNISMTSKGYIVGSSASPFNFQGNTGATATDFNWNDPSFRNGSTNGYLKRWVLSSADLADGNADYDEELVESTCNDFFSRMKGSGASYNTFLFKDGILMNSFIGGSGGSNIIPAIITSMPAINVSGNTALGSSNYLINFGTYTNRIAEIVVQDIGTDNGFIRKNDGMCGTWEKSSAQAFHTPKAANSTVSQMVPQGSLTLETHLVRGINPGDSSIVTYNITAGSADMFPLELFIYADNGTVDDQWDANDVFLQASTENQLTDGPFTMRFLPQDQELIIVVKTVMGCYDQVRLVLNPVIASTTLPVKLRMSTAKAIEKKALVEWVVASNESASQFMIEKSYDKINYSTVGMIHATKASGEAYYSFTDENNENAYYRIRIVSRDKSSFYSPVLFVQYEKQGSPVLSVLNFSKASALTFQYESAAAGSGIVTVYNINGISVFNTQKIFGAGSNLTNLNLDNHLASGLYILEVRQHNNRTVTKFKIQ